MSDPLLENYRGNLASAVRYCQVGAAFAGITPLLLFRQLPGTTLEEGADNAIDLFGVEVSPVVALLITPILVVAALVLAWVSIMASHRLAELLVKASVDRHALSTDPSWTMLRPWLLTVFFMTAAGAIGGFQADGPLPGWAIAPIVAGPSSVMCWYVHRWTERVAEALGET